MTWKKSLLALALCALAPFAAAEDASQDPEELRYLALKYEHARGGVKQDYNEAYRLYCQAYWQGDAQSAYNIGFMNFNARGRARNLGQAMFWFRRAAEKGDLLARRMTLLYKDIASEDDQGCKPPPPPPVAVAEISSPSRKAVEGLVNQIAPRYAIDPKLVMAVIQAESGFNPAAVSPKNAQGLMQLIPATAERFGVKDTWNPTENIRGGTAYLNWLMRHFGGNVVWVLAAYNAGEGAVEKHQGIPPIEETQTYVKRILGHYQKTTHPVPPEPGTQTSASRPANRRPV
ncbi:transglycosylase SLT domain-containing protein [Methylococcus sp. EFPC2]|uniref:transglycosylase SLT domain-containing protein n=1 Tax=Methylococcus sp. EFPC2 TaxID=2812648 RepID=UPI001967DA47|nr:transglycosylase SLT domain-containing protein [Methylococcus sp. EFPC2]QSA96014.1 transglycosylase SLT domain-containing protein [Methylococcus sp. EFPC2]